MKPKTIKSYINPTIVLMLPFAVLKENKTTEKEPQKHKLTKIIKI